MESLKLADPNFLSSDPVDVLLGADVFAAILLDGLKKGDPREPIAQKTSLDWIISGGISSSSDKNSETTFAHHCITTEALTDLVRKFWEQEELSASSVITDEEQRCEEHFVATHSRKADGRYMVRLPLTQKLTDLSTTRFAAVRSLAHMERRFVRDDRLRHMYAEFLQQYEELGHMSPVKHIERRENSRMCYLPHHCASLTTKLRVVFNGSWMLPSGESLNKHLAVGKNLLPNLIDVLLRWRLHKYVVATDIEKMYRQILVHPDDRDLQRIV